MRWFWRKEADKSTGSAIPGQENDDHRRKAFDDVIHMTNSLLLGTTRLVERAAVYDFVIWSLGQQIAADGNVLFVSGKDTPENREYDLSTLFPGINVSSEGVQEFDLSKIPTYTGPWDRNRFPNAIQSIFTHGFRHEMAYNKGILYKELNFAVMLNGRHHTSWGIFAGECIQPMEVISLEPYFPYVKTDGAYLIYTDSHRSRVLHKLIDSRLAAMYRLAQMKWEAGYPNEHTALLSEHYRQSQEADFWREQAETKDKRIKELEQLLSSK